MTLPAVNPGDPLSLHGDQIGVVEKQEGALIHMLANDGETRFTIRVARPDRSWLVIETENPTNE